MVLEKIVGHSNLQTKVPEVTVNVNDRYIQLCIIGAHEIIDKIH